MTDLFAQAAEQRLKSRAPLAARLRPQVLDDVVGQAHLIGPGAPLRVLIENDRVSSAILWGPAGTGKTSLARVIASATANAFVPLSATSAGVKDVREVLEGARRRLGEQGQGTILFIDEVHRFSKSQQDTLLPGVEDGTVVLIGATTENPFFEVNAPLLSRATLWRLHPLDPSELAILINRGLDVEAVGADPEVIELLVGLADGDARAALTTLEVAAALCLARDGSVITRADLEAARSGALHHYGADEHYDQISAFIKSIRGSDVDAGLYWLARMLEAGEDARFIARRLVILASEDVGLADPMGLVLADAAARAIEFVGLPEGALALAHAVIYLAQAPKSNGVVTALGAARADLEGPRHEVPSHLRDAHYSGAAVLGHGVGYVYSHDDPENLAGQGFRPPELEKHRYWKSEFPR